ncbi:integrase, catalytic region [Xanthomonas citri pv. mangiferaeindicae LMG 941]|nr:integrase, catalytic region [Xanthomonas citri pv. mangiferaeindicae LMG 941]
MSETCFRYQAKASEENAHIADWLVRLTSAHRDWGFGLCYLYLVALARACCRVLFNRFILFHS